MNLKTRNAGPWQHTLEIEIPAEEVEHRLDEVAHRVRRIASLPGFRKGKVPLELVKQHFSDHVEREFVDTLVPEMAGEAVNQARLDPVIPPTVHHLRFTPGNPLSFELEVEVRPEVEARDYRGLPAKRSSRPVTEEQVAAVLEDLRQQSAIFVDLDRPGERGDVVLLDSTRLDANGRRLASSKVKSRRIELGAPELPPDLENGLLGATAGQERTIDVQYAADYGVPELAGTRARYVVFVRKIQEKKLREVDDNFARDVFHLESVEDLRSRIRLNLEGEERVRLQREVDDQLATELIRKNPVELPPRWVQWTLDRAIAEAAGSDQVPEALRKELEQRYRQGVENSLRRMVLLAAVARQEELAVSDAEVAAEIQRMMESDPRLASRVRARYQSEERRQALRESLLERKALDWLVDAAEIREENPAAAPLVVPAVR